MPRQPFSPGPAMEAGLIAESRRGRKADGEEVSCTVRRGQPGGKIPFPMQDAPDVDPVRVFPVEDQPGKASQWPDPKPGQVEFVTEAGRTAGRMLGEVIVRTLQGFDEAESGGFSRLPGIVIDGFLHIDLRQGTGYDRLSRQSPVAARARARKASK